MKKCFNLGALSSVLHKPLLFMGMLTVPLLSNASNSYYETTITKHTEDFFTVEDQQAYEISGIVKDTHGTPLPGVTVVIKGTTIGVSTDFDGKYTLNVASGKNVTLVFSLLGMETQEKAVSANKKVVNVTLAEASEQLDEVVITSDGYRKIDRRLFTGAATKVNKEDLLQGMPDVSRALEGKVAGVSVQNVSGTFGAAPKIRVRGASSIFGDTKPLWVVDGVVLEDVVDVSPDQLSSGDAATLIGSSVAGLNADDIESFQILKDASATALYGARAMNGVIVITTKKGKSGKINISYKGEQTLRAKPTYKNYNIMNSVDQMSVYRELESKGWLNHAEISRQSNGGVYKKMYDLINTYNPSTGKFGLENTPEARAKFLQSYERNNTDWFDVLFRNSIIQNHSLSLSGGTDKGNFYFSTSFYNDEGWTLADDVSRFTVNAKANVKVSDRLKIGFLTRGSIRQQTAPGTFKRSKNPVDGAYDRNFDINPFSFALNTSRVLKPYDDNGNYEYYRMNYAPFNIIEELENNQIEMDVLDLKVQGNLDYQITDDLDYSFVGSLRYVKSTQEHKITEKSNLANAYRADDTYEIASSNRFLFSDLANPNALPVVVLPKGGFYNRKDDLLFNYYFRNSLNWNKTYNDKHILNVLVGQELKYSNRENSFFDGVGYQYDRGGIPFIDYRFIQQQVQSGFSYYGMQEYRDRFLAYFSTASYSYNRKYTFNGTFRYDGSNLLGKSKSARWLPTWNVSGSWNAHEEDFLADSDVISYLTLRGTYGLTASMGPARNSSLILMNQISDRPYDSERESQMFIQSLENSELTWEKQFETNLGVDLGLYNNRINLSLDAYKRNGFDLIGNIRTSGIGGEFYKFANYADMESKGVEFTLGTKNIQGKNFSWNTNLTFAYNKNEITNLKSSPNVFDLVQSTGGALENYPVRGLFSIPFAGLNEEGIPTFINENGEVSTDVNFQSENTDFLKYEGPIDPKVTGGLTNTFKYKNFKLNAFVSYQYGNKIRLHPSFKARYSDLDALPNEFKNRWVLPGDEKLTDVPVILSDRAYDVNYERTYNAYNYSDARVADGSFIRMKEISLSYDFPKLVLDNLGLSNAQIRLQGSNLFLLYSDKKLNGQDPEFFRAGGVAMPVSKQYTMSLKIGF
ncbi:MULTISPECIES: SusC/RagA family TonB-linked outer membrane protein [Flavobacteriaceae]|uniref:SusC/RagA family TonB-linked outer membrane protein n=1 Tax=Flavobacteriaceae TaxID=49546 RepID=UPI003AA7F1B8